MVNIYILIFEIRTNENVANKEEITRCDNLKKKTINFIIGVVRFLKPQNN